MGQAFEGSRGILVCGAIALVFAFVGIGPICVKAQAARSRKSQPTPIAGSGTSAPGKGTQLVFDYYPSGLFATKDSELFSVVIGADGTTQAVRYGFYEPAIIAIYEGKITRADVRRLVDRARAAIPKAVQINIGYQGSCDADSFQMLLTSENPSQSKSTLPYPICFGVLTLPADITNLVEEMRGLWKRLPESRLADGYVRSFGFEKDFLKSPYRNIKQFAPIQKFPPKLRAIVRHASKHSPRFYPLSRARFEALLALRSDPSHFFVIDNGRGYSLALHLARTISLSTPPRKQPLKTCVPK